MPGRENRGPIQSPLQDDASDRTEVRTLFHTMLESVPVMTYAMRSDGKAEYANRRFTEFVGPATSLNTWQDRLQLVHPDERAQLETERLRALTGGVEIEMVLRLHRHDGAWRWHRVRVVPFRYPSSAPAEFFLVTAVDIHDLRIAGERASANEERLRLAIEATELGTWDEDMPARLCVWNAQAFRLFGLNPTSEPISPQAWSWRVHPEDRERVFEAYRAALEQGTLYHCEHRIIRADGTERWIDPRGRFLRNDSGQPVRFVGVFSDVTDQRATTAALAESEARFRMLADNIPTLCWMADQAGSVFWYNARWYEYTGLTLEQLQGTGWQSVHDPAVVPRVVERWNNSIAHGIDFEMVFPLKGADGQFRPFLTRGVPVRDEAGRIVRWFGTNTDISAQQAAEEALRLADRRKDEFLATLSHELRNPLAPIRTAAQILASPKIGPQQVHWVQQILNRQVQHLALLLDDLLDMARITQGKLELKIARIALSRIVDAAIEATRPHIDAKNHALSVNLPVEALEVDGDELRLSQVLSNLLTNAAKFTDPGGRIEVSARAEGGTLHLTVKDSGIGLAPGAAASIFTMFSQLQDSLNRTAGGLGVGLALVRGLVALHGGSVEAHSAGIGRGSEFIVHLPLADPPSAPAQSVQESANSLPTAVRRVLIADDNQDAAESLAMLLRLNGHEVRVAHNGREAVTLARVFRPQIALLDLGMPQMNGYEAARLIREEPWGATVTLVALTGWGQDKDKQRVAAAGFDHHMIKPVDTEWLTAWLADALGTWAKPPSPL